MAKKPSIQKQLPAANVTASLLNEPMALYMPANMKKNPVVAEFSYKKFQKIADKVPFTQKEWSNILHLSERTLQRYAKGNISFEGIYVDRIIQLDELIALGLETFDNASSFYDWLKREKHILGHTLNFESLFSTQGIQMVHNEIGRILHGVYI